MKKHRAKSLAASTGCALTMPASNVEDVGAPRAVIETSNRNEAPTTWLATMKAEIVEVRETLREEVAEAAERAHTLAGQKEASALLDTMHAHNAENLRFIDRASEFDDREAMIVLDDLEEILHEVILQLVEIVVTLPSSTHSTHVSARQPVAEL